MRTFASLRRHVRLPLPLLVVAAGTLVASCTTPPDDATIAPAAIISGTLTYSGPKPCTEKGNVLGAGVLLLFDVRNLPPPDGLATRSVRIGVVPGSQLFADLAPSLRFNTDGSRWCPTESERERERVTVSTPFSLAAVGGGRYQVRGFYDLAGDFNPAFKITTASAKGNISGGALTNSTEVAQGKEDPKFMEITVGAEQPDGSFAIPPTGVHLQNVPVTFGKPMPFQRPYFHVKTAYEPVKTQDPAEESVERKEPSVVEVRADWHIAHGPSEITQISKSLLRLEFSSTFPAAELSLARSAPYRFLVSEDSKFDLTWDGLAHVPGTSIPLRAFAPSVVVSKLDPSDPRRLTGQANPRVVSSAIVAKELELLALATSASQQPAEAESRSTLVAMLRPTLICITDPTKNGPAHIITPFKRSLTDNPVVADEAVLSAEVAALLRRNPAKTTFGEGCLLPGDYAVNMVYPTSQSWTLPNEASTCFGTEQPLSAGSCGTRDSTRNTLPSQGFMLRVTSAADPAACRAKVDAAMKASCLSPADLARLEAGTLFN